MNKKRVGICSIISTIPYIIIFIAALYDSIHNYQISNYEVAIMRALMISSIFGLWFTPVIFYVCYTYKPSKPQPASYISEELREISKTHPEIIFLYSFIEFQAMLSFIYAFIVFYIGGITGCPEGFVPYHLSVTMLLILLTLYLWVFFGILFVIYCKEVISKTRIQSLWFAIQWIIAFIFFFAIMFVSAEIGDYENPFSYLNAAILSLLCFGAGLSIPAIYLGKKIKRLKKIIHS